MYTYTFDLFPHQNEDKNHFTVTVYQKKMNCYTKH